MSSLLLLLILYCGVFEDRTSATALVEPDVVSMSDSGPVRSSLTNQEILIILLLWKEMHVSLCFFKYNILLAIYLVVFYTTYDYYYYFYYIFNGVYVYISPCRVVQYDGIYHATIQMCLLLEIWQYHFYHGSYSRVISFFSHDLTKVTWFG